MKKRGKLLNTEHQLCYALTLHLAVCDVIYKREDVDFSYEGLDTKNSLVKNAFSAVGLFITKLHW